MDKLDFIYNRRSVRKFKDLDIPMEDINEIIKAAGAAPSGRNLQNWHFVVVKDKEKINKVAEIIEMKSSELAECCNTEEEKKNFRKRIKYHTFFKHAPVLIIIYAGQYPNDIIDILKAKGESEEEIADIIKPNTGIQNIGAAVENLLLAASSMGYGTCWMTGPVYARKELEDFIGLGKEDYYIAAMTPLGVPDDNQPPRTSRKPLSEIMTVI